jgi:hypothetical protein
MIAAAHPTGGDAGRIGWPEDSGHDFPCCRGLAGQAPEVAMALVPAGVRLGLPAAVFPASALTGLAVRSVLARDRDIEGRVTQAQIRPRVG